VGPEVLAEGVKILKTIEVRISARFAVEEFSVGAAEFLRSGDALPRHVLTRLEEFDAILLGAIGLPEVRLPSGVEITPQIDLREDLDLYIGLRPVKLLHPGDSPLKSASIDFLLVRENTEGLFSARKKLQPLIASEASDVMLITREPSERIFRAAFREAAKRRRKVTLVDKANVLPSMAFFRAVFDRIAREFPEIVTERVYVDAMALYLVQRPQTFDVIVTENMFGDILSDLAAGLVGGMGMAPSADIGERHAVFQPAHGSAPDIAGRGIANPVATILSVAMMLEWLGESQGGALIRQAVSAVFDNPANRTVEMGGALTTTQMGDRVAEAIAGI
jgi:3-isopropylmalate dehydrogenase